jgi:argininosuccinate lyase
MLALLKGLPTGYNKDLQEDKAILFDSVDTLRLVLPAFTGALETARVNADACARALDPSTLAADVADALVQSGLSFAQAHGIVGKLVHVAESRGVGIFDLPEADVRALHPALPGALSGTADPEGSVERRTVTGGTARAAVLRQIEEARRVLAESPGA